tara:strand:+ start:674 stop:1687 length:1014 start_codon:yes stop_codon:yes gene_type:complete
MSYSIYLSLIIGILFLIFLSKKYSFFIDRKIEKHKNIVSTDKNYFLGGIIFMLFFMYYFLITQEFSKLFFLLSIFLIGLVSDFTILNDPRKRFLLQLITILFFVIWLDIKIPSTRLTQLDILLEYSFINYFFVTFCLMVLVNGSNFTDGINTLLLSYFTIIFAFIFFNKNYILTDYDLVFDLILLFMIIIFLNSIGIIILGDSGSYLISIFAGIFLIEISNKFTVSPYYIILLLWYPCFELLFSMTRRYLNKNSSYKPDTKHLHQILYKSIKKINNFKNIKINHLLTSIIINLYNFLSFYIGTKFISQTQALIIIIILNIFFYLLFYSYLIKRFKSN